MKPMRNNMKLFVAILISLAAINRLEAFFGDQQVFDLLWNTFSPLINPAMKVGCCAAQDPGRFKKEVGDTVKCINDQSVEDEILAHINPYLDDKSKFCNDDATPKVDAINHEIEEVKKIGQKNPIRYKSVLCVVKDLQALIGKYEKQCLKM